jgi:hypothetical protein
MAYPVTPAALEVLNYIIGNIGGPVAGKVSDALGKMQAAYAAGNGIEAKRQFDIAVQENIAGNQAWQLAQFWHDSVKKLKQVGAGEPDPSEPTNEDGWTEYPPHIPPGDNLITPTQKVNGGWDCGTVQVNGTRNAVVLERGDWAFFKADRDGDVASGSCDGVGLAWGAFDTPTDPGNAGYPNTAEVRPYKAGQFVCMKPLEGGYNATRAVLFNVMKYGA